MTGRGCSTKDKVFYKECETHSYGEQVEKMCFCSYFLCNLSSALAPPSCLLLMIIGATLCVLNSDYSACLISRTSLAAATPLINSSSHSGLVAHNTKPRWFLLKISIRNFFFLKKSSGSALVSWELPFCTVVLSCGSERKNDHGIWPSPSLSTIFSELEIKKIEMF